jgi:hypothetical protein
MTVLARTSSNLIDISKEGCIPVDCNTRVPGLMVDVVLRTDFVFEMRVC